MMRRILAGVGACLVVTSVMPGAGSQAAAPLERVELQGTGAWEIINQLTPWKNALYYSTQSLNLSYIAKGDRDGRQIFARGEADFAVSAFPMNDEDNAALAARNVKVISAPISVGSAAILISGPYAAGLQTFVEDPVNPDEGGTFAPWGDVLRMPNTTLSKIWLEKDGNNWYDADFLAANAPFIPAGGIFAPVINPSPPVVRSDPSAPNYYMQQLARETVPKVFAEKVKDERLPDFPISESWPFLSAASRSSSVNVAALVAGWQSPQSSVIPLGGVITATPLSEALSQKAQHPETPLYIPQIQNKAGEWIAPTAQSITTAIDKGDGQPLAALETSIPGGYPLAWVDRLYAPASGLGVDAANGLATMVRYAVTTGQGAADLVGEGRLSQKLVDEALIAADGIISGNCVGNDRKIVTATDGGPLWPTGVAMPKPSFTVCVALTAAATTTAAPTTMASPTVSVESANISNPSYSSSYPYSSAGSLGSAGSISDLSGSSGTFSESAAAAPDSAAPSSAAAPAAQSAALVAATMPLKPPDDGRGNLDRLATMLLGAIGAVLVRNFLKRSKATT